MAFSTGRYGAALRRVQQPWIGCFTPRFLLLVVAEPDWFLLQNCSKTARIRPLEYTLPSDAYSSPSILPCMSKQFTSSLRTPDISEARELDSWTVFWRFSTWLLQVMGSLAKPFHSVSFGDEEVYCVSFSPYEWSKNYLAIGTKNKVAIANVLLKNVSHWFNWNVVNLNNIDAVYYCIFQDELDFSIIREFHHLCPVITVAWSPIASTDSVPKVCKFATAGTDGKIRIYSSDLSNSENVLVKFERSITVTFYQRKKTGLSSFNLARFYRNW